MHSECGHAIDDRSRRVGSGQIGADHVRLDALALTLARDLTQLVFAARDEHDVVPVGGEDACQLEADAARRAGDERGHLR